MRFFLAPRYDLEKTNKLALLNPVFAPVEIWSFYTSRAWGFPVLRRPSQWIAFPTVTALWMLPFVVLQYQADAYDIQALDLQIKADRFGAAYVSDYVQQGRISLKEAATELATAQTEFLEALKPLRHRVRTFVEEGLWSEEQGALARKILDELIRDHKPSDLIVVTGLTAAIAAHPLYLELSKQIKPGAEFTLNLWTEPEISLFGVPDSAWIASVHVPEYRRDLTAEEVRGLESLRRNNEALEYALPLTTLAIMASDTVMDRDAVEGKRREAQSSNVPPDRDFLYRVDFPIFQSEQPLRELHRTVEVKTEVDLWSLMFSKDPRFSGLIEAMDRGEASEFAVLFETSGRIHDLNEVYDLERHEGEPQPQDFCTLIYGKDASDQPNAYFASLQSLGGNSWQTAAARVTFDALRELSLAKNADDLARADQNWGKHEASLSASIEAGAPAPQGSVACSNAR